MQWAFGLVAAALAAGFAWLRKRLRKQSTEQDAVVEGVKAILHDRLWQAHKFYSKQGYCPLDDKKNIEYLYTPYHNLGGNGTGTVIYGDIMEMPTELDDTK